MWKKSHTILAAFAIGIFATTASAAVQEPPAPPPPPPPPPMGEKMFERLDANHDGVIDRAEFNAVRERIGRRLRGVKSPQESGDKPRGEGDFDGPRNGGPHGKRPEPNQAGPRGEGRFDGPREGGPREAFRDGPMGGQHDGPAIQEIQRVIRDAIDGALRDHPADLCEKVGDAVIAALKSHMHGQMARRRDGRGPGEPGMAPPNANGQGGPRDDGPPPLGGPRGPGHGRQRGMGPDRDGDDNMAPPPGDRPAMQQRRRGGEQKGTGRNDERGRFRAPQNRGDRQGWRNQTDGRQPRMRFKKMDANGDGYLTADEFKGGPERFKRIDANSDGKLSKEELRDAVRGQMQNRREGGRQGEGAGKPGERGPKRDRNARRVVI